MQEEQALQQQETEDVSPSAEEEEAAQEQPQEEAQEGAAEEPGAEEPQDEREPEHVPYERFSKIYGRMKHLERELESLRAGTPKPREAAQEADLKLPNEDDFDTYEDYQEARTAYLVKQEVQREREREKEARELDKQAKLWRAFDEKVARAEAHDPQFRERAYLPTGMEQHIIESPKAIEICYYLGDHPEVRDDLVALLDQPLKLAREIGKIEAKITTGPPQKSTTRAPGPTSPVSGKETVAKTLDDLATTDVGAYIRAKNKAEGLPVD